jgi:hypothetical protein
MEDFFGGGPWETGRRAGGARFAQSPHTQSAALLPQYRVQRFFVVTTVLVEI